MNSTNNRFEKKPSKYGCLGTVLNILFIAALLIGGYFGYKYIAENYWPQDENATSTKQEETVENSEESGESETSEEETTESSDKDTREVVVQEITSEPLSRINFAKVGTISPYKKITLTSETAGNVNNFEKTEGDEVEKGDQIAEISDSVSTKITQINYDSALKSLELAMKSLEGTKDSVSQDAKSALIGAQTAQLNYNNAITSFNNLASILEEQIRSTKLGVQAAEIGLQSAQENYYNSISSNSTTLDNTLDQSLGGVVSALTLVDGALDTLDTLYGTRHSYSNDSVEDILDEYASSSQLRNAEQDIEDLEDTYFDLYDEYETLRGDDDPNALKNLINDTVDLLENTQQVLYDSKNIIDDVLNEDNADVQAVSMTLFTTKTSLSALLPSMDQSKSGLRQSEQAIEMMVMNNQFQPEGALTGLESAEVQLTSARQALAQAEANANSQLDSAQHGINVAAKQVDSAYAQLASIQAKGDLQVIGSESQLVNMEGQVDILAVNLDSSKLVSPIDGIILETFIEEGNYVNPSQRIATVADMTKVKVKVSLTTEELAFVKLGQNVIVEGPAGIKQTGRITKVLPGVNPVSKKVDIEIIIPNKDLSFKSGMFTEVVFSDAQVDSASTFIPFKSITFNQNNPYIYIVGNNKAVKKQVKLGQISGNVVEIVSGLSKGDLVITEGAKFVSEGETVSIKNN